MSFGGVRYPQGRGATTSGFTHRQHFSTPRGTQMTIVYVGMIKAGKVQPARIVKTATRVAK